MRGLLGDCSGTVLGLFWDCSGRFISGARPKVDFWRMYEAICSFQGGWLGGSGGGGRGGDGGQIFDIQLLSADPGACGGDLGVFCYKGVLEL